VGLILFLENLLTGDRYLRDEMKRRHKDEFGNIDDYCIACIEEFEKLVQILAKDERQFEKIIDTKLSLHCEKPRIDARTDFEAVIDGMAPQRKVEFLEQYCGVVEEIMRLEAGAMECKDHPSSDEDL
jgi:hypothetical protein